MDMRLRNRLLIAGTWLILCALPAGASEPTIVQIEKYKFVPATVKVKVGSTVKWVNEEKRTSHSIIFKEAGVAESPRFFPGESWERKFDKPGTYPYTCGPHPEMHGVVEVTP